MATATGSISAIESKDKCLDFRWFYISLVHRCDRKRKWFSRTHAQRVHHDNDERHLVRGRHPDAARLRRARASALRGGAHGGRLLVLVHVDHYHVVHGKLGGVSDCGEAGLAN